MQVNHTEAKTQAANKPGRTSLVGEFDFTVVSAEETTSKAGNEMFTLELSVQIGNGKPWTVRDYASTAAWSKVRSLFDSVGLSAKYEAGTITAEDLVGRTGTIKTRTEAYTKKDGTPGEKPVVQYYIPSTEQLPADVKPLSAGSDEDDADLF